MNWNEKLEVAKVYLRILWWYCLLLNLIILSLLKLLYWGK